MKKNKTSYIEVTLPEYLSVVNYCRQNNFTLSVNSRTNNKTWKNKDKRVVAKRIANKSESDTYMIEKQFYNELNNKN